MGNTLILGGFGFIGTNVVQELLNRGKNDIIIFELKNIFIQDPSLLEKVKVVYGDFNNEKDTEVIFQENQIDLVIHLISATIPSNENIIYDINANLVNTIRLLELMKKYQVKKIVFLSSGGTIYGVSETGYFKETDPTNPISSYGVVKLAIEKVLYLYNQLSGIDYLILRPSNPFGEYHTSTKQGFINIALKKIMSGEKIVIWGDGEVIRDYIYIKDLASIIADLIELEISNDIINIGSGEGHTLNNILEILREQIGEFEVEYNAPRKFDVPCTILNIDKMMSLLKYPKKTDLNWAVAKTFNWLDTELHQS